MKTAMRELLDYLEEDDRVNSKAKVFVDFLEKENFQIRSAYREGYNDSSMGKIIHSEDYYNQTYQQNNQKSNT